MKRSSDFLKPSQVIAGSTSLPFIAGLLPPAMDGLSELSPFSFQFSHLEAISDLHAPFSSATTSSGCVLGFDEPADLGLPVCAMIARLAWFIVPGHPRMTRLFT